MPPPYPLHGSGSDPCWSSVPGDSVLRAIKNRSYFLILVRSDFVSMLGPIWEPFGTPFGVKIDPRFVQEALRSLIFFKNTMFTEPLKKTNEFQ